MRKAAVEKAKDRFASAKARVKDLESSKDYDSARRHWYDFLLSSNVVFSILEQGAKGFDKSQNWFGKRRNERKHDPLLCYLHHARNAAEHNIFSVTELDRRKMVLVENGTPAAAIEEMTGNAGKFRGLSSQAANLEKINEIRIYPDRAKLIRVKDRGNEYDPPSEHQGSAIDDNGPITVARLMVRYIELMIDEAQSLIAEG
jgi:hypothetical protein